MIVMNANLLRQVWNVVETTQTDVLTQLDDPQLTQVLVTSLKERDLLSLDEETKTKAYIQSRMLLIRESAQSRQELCCPLNIQRTLQPAF